MCDPARTSTPKVRASRRGSTTLFLLIAVILAAVAVAIIWYTVRGRNRTAGDVPLTSPVTRGAYDHIVLEEGEVESSNNVELRCEVRSRSAGSGPATSIIDIVPEGKLVQPGDWLITFDSSALEQERSRQRITVNTSEALVIQAKAVLDTALIAREEYLQGAYNEQRKAIENEIFVAEESLKKAQLSYDSIKRLVSRGLLASLQLEGEKYRVDAAQNVLDLAKQKLQVLEEFTKKKMLTQLDSDIEAAQVRYKNEQDSHKEELNKLQEIEDQIAKCTVKAPQAGQVVYANVQSSRSGSEFVVEPGASVRENQVLIRLPDPNAMQVKAKISESRINLVHEGLPVAIRIDAFGDKTIAGEVTKVNKYAEPSNFWMATGKEYLTLIKIHEPPPELRVGLTAEVRIHVEHRDDALQIPVQAVYERGGKTFCLVKKGEGAWDTREVVISSTNDKMVALDEEKSEPLQPGEEVVLNPRRHLDKFDQSRFPLAGKDVVQEIAKQAPAKRLGGKAGDAGGPASGDAVAGAPGASGPPGAGGPGSGGPGRGGRGNPAQMIERMDQDGDGKLSRDELPEQMRERFAEADTNGDGFFDAGEMGAAFSRMRAAGGGPGGPGGPPGDVPGGGQ